MEVTVYSFFCLTHLFSVKSEIALIKQKGGITDISETFNAIELFLHLFRLIAGHMPKPVKLGDVLQYILSSRESEVEMGVCWETPLTKPIDQENYRFRPSLFLLATCAPSRCQQSGSLQEKVS